MATAFDTQHRTFLPALSALVLGCVGTPAIDTVPPPPADVPSDGLPELALVGRCVDLADRERFVGSGAGGEAWIASGDGETFRVVTPSGDESRVSLGLSPDVFLPWTGDSAAFAAGSRLFVREGDETEEVHWPSGLGDIVDLCGDPRRDGAFVLSAGSPERPAGLYRHEHGEWWQWSPRSDDFGAMSRLATLAGACSGVDDRAWLQTSRGLWSLRTETLVRHPALVGDVELAIDPAVGVATAVDGRLLFLRDRQWMETRFERGAVSHLSGAAGRLWVVAGGRIHHYAKGRFSLVSAELPGSLGRLHPDANGGFWIESGADEICHRAPRSVLRVTGLRPYERRTARGATLHLEGEGHARVRLDDATVGEGSLEAGLTVEVADLGPPGWHRLDVVTSDEERRLDVFVIDTNEAPTSSWERDIRPLYEAHCAGSGCHGSDVERRPRLDRYEDWVELSETIQHRVAEVGDMPPAIVRRGWSAAEISTVVAWIAAGMEE